MLAPLFLMLQSVTPYGSPVADNVQPVAPKLNTEAHFKQCVDQAIDDPSKGIARANTWRINGGGFLARHCLGFAYSEQGNWSAATRAFVDAAREAEIAKYERTAHFWAQAGNAALAEGQAEQALDHLNAALVQGTLAGLYKGEVHLDRARAHVALGDYEAAKTEFGQVHELAPQDPLGWLLSATLARRTGNLVKAKADIEKADKLVRQDPAIALEAGNIAFAAKDYSGAETFWKKAVEMDAESQPGRVAAVYLGRLKKGVAEPKAN